MSDNQRGRIGDLVLKTLELKDVIAVQVDFDVATSERQFYRKLLGDLRTRLSEDIPLSMTALVSFCLGDRWMEGLPVDEAIPMIFRMGRDQDSIRAHLRTAPTFANHSASIAMEFLLTSQSI